MLTTIFNYVDKGSSVARALSLQICMSSLFDHALTSRQELRRLLSHFQLELTDLEFNDIWAMVDVGGDPSGTVDFWELVEAFQVH